MLKRAVVWRAAAAAAQAPSNTAPSVRRPQLLTTPIKTAEDVVALVLKVSPLQPVGSALHLPLDPVHAVFGTLAVGTFFVTYFIIFNWIYEGYCDLWDGTYGLDDDDDEDD